MLNVSWKSPGIFLGWICRHPDHDIAASDLMCKKHRELVEIMNTVFVNICICVLLSGQDLVFVDVSMFRLQELRGESTPQDTDALGGRS